MMRLVHGIAITMMGILMLVAHLAAAGVHLFTVFIAYQFSGLFAAFVTLLFPLAGTLFWIFNIWMQSGIFFHSLTVASLGVILLYVIMMMFAGVASATEPAR